MNESERAKNLGNVVGGQSKKNAAYNLLNLYLGLRGGNKFADRGRMKTPADWDNEIRAHELKADINHHYGTKRAEGDLDRETRSLANVHATTPKGRVVQRSERDGKGGYKVHYGEGAKPAAAEEKKKPTARRTTRKPAAKPAADKKPAIDKKPAARTPRAKAAPKKENPGMNYFSEEKYP
jgi:hypothetical protein